MLNARAEPVHVIRNPVETSLSNVALRVTAHATAAYFTESQSGSILIATLS